MRKLMIAVALAATSTLAVAPAAAQVSVAPGLVTVNVQDVSVLNNFLNDTQIAALNNLNVPVTVQAPISIAANVCGTTVAALSALRKTGGAECTATSGSRALANIVNRQMLKQKK